MKKFFSLVMVIVLASSSALQAAAITQWAQDRARSARKKASELARYPRRAVSVVKKKYIDKKALTPSEQALLSRLQIGTIVAILAALAGITAVALSRRELEDAPLVIEDTSGPQPVVTGEILDRHGVELAQDDSIQALLIKAASNGSLEWVKKLSGLVPENVLAASAEIAARRSRGADVYAQIGLALEAAMAAFDAEALQIRLAFIRNAVGELVKEVRRTICQVTPETIEEAIARVTSKKPKGLQDAEVLGVLQGGCPRK